MTPRDESERPEEVRVTDRRRFTETGEERGASAPAEPSPRAAEPRALSHEHPLGAGHPEHLSGAAPRASAGPHEVVDLGIEAVFFVFYQSALIALGAPEIVGEQRPPDLAEAKQAIDFLRVLEAKTAGNLSPEEASTLRQLLDDAQMRFVHVARSMAGGRG